MISPTSFGLLSQPTGSAISRPEGRTGFLRAFLGREGKPSSVVTSFGTPSEDMAQETVTLGRENLSLVSGHAFLTKAQNLGLSYDG